MAKVMASKPALFIATVKLSVARERRYTTRAIREMMASAVMEFNKTNGEGVVLKSVRVEAEGNDR